MRAFAVYTAEFETGRLQRHLDINISDVQLLTIVGSGRDGQATEVHGEIGAFSNS